MKSLQRYYFREIFDNLFSNKVPHKSVILFFESFKVGYYFLRAGLSSFYFYFQIQNISYYLLLAKNLVYASKVCSVATITERATDKNSMNRLFSLLEHLVPVTFQLSGGQINVLGF